MTFFVLALTPYEALGTFTGLEIQAALRAGLAWLPALIWLALSFSLVTRLQGRSPGEIAAALVKYSAVVLFILGAFWPEAFGHAPEPLAPTAVVSGIAQEHGGPHANAQALDPSAQPTGVPALTLALINGLSEMSFNLGKTLHEGATKPASFVMPLNWLLRQRLSDGQRNDVRDWAEACVAPAYLRLQARGASLTFAESLPFAGTPVGAELARLRAPLGRELLNMMRGMENCGVVGQQLVAEVAASLNGLTTPAGASMTDLWRQELGTSADEIARMLIYREVQDQLGGGGVSAPSLKGEVATIGGAKGVVGFFRGLLAGGPFRVAGALKSVAGAALGDLEGALQGLASWLAPSMIFLEYAPPLLGFMQGVFLAMMPLALVLALVPGTPFRPLFLYVAWLGILYSSPIWWGMIELFIATFADAAPGGLNDPAQWAYTLGLKLILQTLGLAVALVMGLLLTGLTGFAAMFSRLS